MKNLLLKIIATLAFGAVGFPFMLACDANRYGNIDALRHLMYFAVLAAAFGFGCLCTAFVRDKSAIKPKRQTLLRALLRIVGCLTFFLGTTAYIIKGDAATVLTLGGYCIFAFFVGERFIYKNFTDMYPLSGFAFYLVFATGSYFFARVSLAEELAPTVMDIIVWAFCIELVIAGLLVNQSGISVKANMRRETKASLPKGLTAYNAALILGLSVAALSLVTLSGTLGRLLEQGFVILLKAFVFFMSLFNAETFPLEQGEGDGRLDGSIEAEPSPLWEAALIVVLVFLAVKFRKKIFAAVKSVFARLGRWLGSKPEDSEIPEFTDRYEDYAKSRRERQRPFSRYALAAMYKTERDPLKKFRYGYALMLCRIRSYNHSLTVSDTVEEQAKKGEKYFDPEKLTCVAGAYNAARYGALAPDENAAGTLDEMISNS